MVRVSFGEWWRLSRSPELFLKRTFLVLGAAGAPGSAPGSESEAFPPPDPRRSTSLFRGLERDQTRHHIFSYAVNTPSFFVGISLFLPWFIIEVMQSVISDSPGVDGSL